MVAYSFQSRFVPLIRAGLKTQTIRADRKRHARPGERLQLFTAMRTRFCERIVPDPVCTAVLPVAISWNDTYSGENLLHAPRIARIEVGMIPVRDLDSFVTLDGFSGIDDMTAFWLAHHGARPFEGVVIEWAMPRAEALAA